MAEDSAIIAKVMDAFGLSKEDAVKVVQDRITPGFDDEKNTYFGKVPKMELKDMFAEPWDTAPVSTKLFRTLLERCPSVGVPSACYIPLIIGMDLNGFFVSADNFTELVKLDDAALRSTLSEMQNMGADETGQEHPRFPLPVALKTVRAVKETFRRVLGDISSSSLPPIRKEWYKVGSMSELPSASEGRHKKLFDWAYEKGWHRVLEKLIREEHWGEKRFALTNYIQATFSRLLTESKVWVYGDTQNPSFPARQADMVVFHTGLVSRDRRLQNNTQVPGGQEVLAVLTPRSKELIAKDSRPWNLMVAKHDELLGDGCFVTPAHLTSKDRFMKCPVPERATFTDDLRDLVFDSTIPISVMTEHLLAKEQRKRLPEEFRATDPRRLKMLLEGAVKRAETEAKANFMLAVPQYYRSTLQFLLPLYLTNDKAADLALVMRRDGQRYTIKTWLLLPWAYVNARLVAPVSQAWLVAGLDQDPMQLKAATGASVGVRSRAGAGAGAGARTEATFTGSDPTTWTESPRSLPTSASPPDFVSGGSVSAPAIAGQIDLSGGGSTSFTPSASSGSVALSSSSIPPTPLSAPISAPSAPLSHEAPGWAPASEPSICIPWVRHGVKQETVAEAFSKLGVIDRVDFVPKLDHFRCFVHFKAWNTTDPDTARIRASLLQGRERSSATKQVIVHGDQTWQYSASRARNPRRRVISTPATMSSV